MDCSTPDLTVYHQLPEFTQTCIHWVSDAIQPSHPLSSPSSPIFNLSQNQDLFQWISSSHQVAKVLEFQLWMVTFKRALKLSSSTFKNKLFSSFSVSAIRVVSSAYLRLLIFLPAILIPACASSSPAFHMKYSACKLNKPGDNIQPWCTPFPIWNQSVCSVSGSQCCFLTCIQISQEASQVVWYSHLFQNFPQLWSTQSKALA